MRLAGTGFEMGIIPYTVLGYPGLVTTNVRTGTYAMRIPAYSDGCVIPLGASVDELYARIAFRPSGSGASGYNGAIVGFLEADGTTHITICVGDPTPVLQVRLGSGTQSAPIATGSLVLTMNVWYLIEIHLVIANTGGVVQVKVDGVTDINFSGDTRNGGTNGTATVARIGITAHAFDYPAYCGLIDDVAFNDTSGDYNNTWVGRGGMWPVLVTGAGDLAQFTPSAGSNYECVDERPPNADTDYVSSDTEGNRDTYAVTIPEGVTGGVTAFTLWHYAKLAEAGAGNLTPSLRKSGVSYDGDVKGLDTSYRYVSEIWEANPATTEPWTLEDLAEFYVGQATS